MSAMSALPLPSKSATSNCVIVTSCESEETGSGFQGCVPPQLTNQPALWMLKTSVSLPVPQTAKCPKRSWLTRKEEAAAGLNEPELPEDIHHCFPSAQKISARPSPSKSPTAMSLTEVHGKGRFEFKTTQSEIPPQE